MKLFLLALPLTLAACVTPECVVMVNGQPVYNQCYQHTSVGRDEKRYDAPQVDDDKGGDDSNGDKPKDDSNGDKSKDNSKDSNGDKSKGRNKDSNGDKSKDRSSDSNGNNSDEGND